MSPFQCTPVIQWLHNTLSHQCNMDTALSWPGDPAEHTDLRLNTFSARVDKHSSVGNMFIIKGFTTVWVCYSCMLTVMCTPLLWQCLRVCIVCTANKTVGSKNRWLKVHIFPKGMNGCFWWARFGGGGAESDDSLVYSDPDLNFSSLTESTPLHGKSYNRCNT